MSDRWSRRLLPLLGLLLLGGSVWFLIHELRGVNFDKVVQGFLRTPSGQLARAATFSLLGYLVIYGYDLLGLRYVRQPMGLGRTLLASFVGGAFSNSISLPILGVGGLRFRFYREWGLSAAQIMELLAYIGLGAWMGLLTLTGLSLLIYPPVLPINASLSDALVRGLGATLLASVIGYLAVCGWLKTLHLGRWTVPVPTRGQAVVQLLVGVADWSAQAMVVYSLMPPVRSLSLSWFLPAYFASMTMAMIGHLPAGLGVFDTGMLLMLPAVMSREQLIDVLMLYRVIYHLAPLALAIGLLGIFEIYSRVQRHFHPSPP